MEKVYQQNWMALSKELRSHLMKEFNISKSGITEVRDETVLSDGVTNDDLKMFSVESMSAYLSGGTGSFGALWELTLQKAKEDMNTPVKSITIDVSSIELMPEVKPVEEPLQAKSKKDAKNKQK